VLLLSVYKDVLTGLLIPAALAVLGYVGKEVAQAYGGWQAAKKARRVRLHQLQSLLSASRTAFEVQRAQADRLARILGGDGGAGLESLFENAFDGFTTEQSNLHTVIRAYTQYALRPLNQAMQTWLGEDVDHRVTRGKDGAAARLAQQLNQLDAHLWLWLAKYEAWIPHTPRHALVYLADEHDHGLAFPVGIEQTLEQVLTEKL
jgi:hypothetical protein